MKKASPGHDRHFNAFSLAVITLFAAAVLVSYSGRIIPSTGFQIDNDFNFPSPQPSSGGSPVTGSTTASIDCVIAAQDACTNGNYAGLGQCCGASTVICSGGTSAIGLDAGLEVVCSY
jgi:hypothetical protein